MACTATCGSLAQACTQMSPPQRAGSIVSLGNFGRSRSGCGPLVGDAEAVLAVLDEERRAEPDGQRQLRRGQAERLTGVRRRRVRVEADGAVGDGLLAARHPLGHVRPFLQHRHDVVTAVGGDVEGGEVHPVLRRGDDAGLAFAAERHRPTAAPRCELSAADARPASAPAPAAPTTAAPTPAAPSSLRRENPRARVGRPSLELMRTYWGAMTPCTWLTSLDSASIARDSSWR